MSKDKKSTEIEVLDDESLDQASGGLSYSTLKPTTSFDGIRADGSRNLGVRYDGVRFEGKRFEGIRKLPFKR